MENSVRVALKDVQAAFQGEAERLGLKDEQDVTAMINELRLEKQERASAITPANELHNLLNIDLSNFDMQFRFPRLSF